MFGADTLALRFDGPGATDNDVEEYREAVPPIPVVWRDRARDEAILALREERREDGGAYSRGDSGGYGSMMRTSWTAETPKPAVSYRVTDARQLRIVFSASSPLYVTSMSGFQSLMFTSSSSVLRSGAGVASGSGLMSIPLSSSSSSGTAVLLDRARVDRDRERLLVLSRKGVVRGGGDGGLKENVFCLSRTTSVRVVFRRK